MVFRYFEWKLNDVWIVYLEWIWPFCCVHRWWWYSYSRSVFVTMETILFFLMLSLLFFRLVKLSLSQFDVNGVRKRVNVWPSFILLSLAKWMIYNISCWNWSWANIVLSHFLFSVCWLRNFLSHACHIRMFLFAGN